jgi:hypothetical protein
MAIGQSKLHSILRKGKELSEKKTWYNFFYRSDVKKQILHWIQEDQLRSKGIDKTGEVIGTYSIVTEWISGGRKQHGDHYTLDDTGDFFRSMFVAVFSDRFEIDADPIKKTDSSDYFDGYGEENLFDKYGTGIIGLTDENLEKLKEKILAHYQNELKRILKP